MDSDSCGAIQVTVEAGAWEDAGADLDRLCRGTVTAAIALAAPAVAPRAEIGVLLTDDAAIRELNRAWRGKDRPTNVLSFPLRDWGAPPAEGLLLLGDIVVAYETTRREAAEAGRPLAQHLQHLLVHGTLHLLGHDHEETEAAERMERLEATILAGLGVPDPYREEAAA
jgi:probable rRNA maturation factor